MPEPKRGRAGWRPLTGRTVLVTRPSGRETGFVRELERRGARTLVAPTIEIHPARSAALTSALQDLARGEFAWIVVTSVATVDMLAARMRDPVGVRANVAAIGEGTADAFHDWAGRSPDLVPATFTTAALARAFPRGSGRVLCARADIAPEGLEDELARKGWTAERVDAYRTRVPRSLPAAARSALRRGEIDAVTFTSASTVRGFATLSGTGAGSARIVCIGPVTARAARERGFRVHAVARPHTAAGLVDAVVRAIGPRPATLSP